MKEKKFRNRFRLLPCWGFVVFFSSLAIVTSQAATSRVSLTEWDAFSLDVDGDGEPDFEGSLSNEQNVALISRFDTSLATNQFPGLLPGQGAGGSSTQFASLTELQASEIYSGDVIPVTPLFGDLHLGTSVVVLNANKAKPVWAGWRFGTSGKGNEPFQVIGFILDTSAFFESGGTAEIELHTFHYGLVALGDTLSNLSLASALDGIASQPIPPVADVPVDVTFEFDGPWRGSFSVMSQLGKTYHLHRSVDLLNSIITESQAGTGGILSFEFDDSQAPANQAFYWLAESDQP